MPLEGLRIGRYHIIRLLGSGGMGEVYLAEDARIEQQVAIKVIRGEVSPYPHAQGAKDAARLFQREAKAIAKLDHPHILPLFDYGEEIMDGMTLIYIVMPFRQEGSLADWLHQRGREELLSPQEVAHIINQAADALHYAHNHQIIHRDVKPSNFLVRTRQETPDYPDILLADFGIAKLITTTSSASQSARGTPVYMSPEQCIGAPVPASDQYALGIMAYELLTGQPPFQGGAIHVMYQHLQGQPQPPSTLNVRLPVDIDAVLLRALAKKPEERFASITAFAQAFQHAVQSPDMATFVKPVNMPSDGDIHPPLAINKAEAVETNAPTVTSTSPQPPASTTDPHMIPVFSGPMTPANTSPEDEDGGSTQHNTVNADTTQQNTDSAARGKTAHVREEDEIRDRPSIGTITPPIQESGTVTPRRRTKRRPLLITALVLLTVVVVVFGSVAYAAPSIFSSLAHRVLGGLSNAPLIVSSATVTITPASKDLEHLYTIPAVTGTPDTSKHQVKARPLSSTTPQQSKTVDATGTGTTPATPAKGSLTFYNPDGPGDYLSVPAYTTWTGSDGTRVMNDQPVCLNGVSTTSSVDVPAQSVLSGSSYNIAANDINQNAGSYVSTSPCSSTAATTGLTLLTLKPEKVAKCDCRTYMAHSNGIRTYTVPLSGCCGSYVSNTAAFTGGKDSSTYSVVKQSDIDGAGNALETTYSPDPQQVLQGQVHANEHFAGTPTCNPNVTADHNADDAATTVTVTVNFTCTGEVYDQQGALAMAQQWLKQDAAQNPGPGYMLVGSIVTTQGQAKISDANQGTISIPVTAKGVWVYQFSNAQKQELAKLIAGKRKQDALALLSRHEGVSHSDIRISGGDGNTLPTDPKQIKIEV